MTAVEFKQEALISVMFLVSTCLIAETAARRSTNQHEMPLIIRVGSCDFVDRLL